jgi:hypothetical protein
MTDVVAIVVTGPQPPRNPVLVVDLMKRFQNVITVHGPDLSTKRQAVSHKDRLYEWMRHGRLLTSGEIAAREAHRGALAAFLKTDSTVAFIIEDDADCSTAGSDLTSAIHNFGEMHGRSIWSLYPPNRSVSSQSSSMYPKKFSLKYAPGAVAYLVNRAAAEIAISTPDLGEKADWPGWMGRMSYRFMPVYSIGMTESMSLVGHRSFISSNPVIRFSRYVCLALGGPYLLKPMNFGHSLKTYFVDLCRQWRVTSDGNRFLFRR